VKNRRYSTQPLPASDRIASREEVHSVYRKVDKLDGYLDNISRNLSTQAAVPLETLYSQYRHNAGTIIPSVIPYDERPPSWRRADVFHGSESTKTDLAEGSGVVLVVHVQYDEVESRLAKVVVCSGFVVDASITRPDQGDVIVTCAHTLEEVRPLHPQS